MGFRAQEPTLCSRSCPSPPCSRTHPELLFDLAGVCLRVQLVHVVVQRPDLGGRDGGVSAETGFQNGIMDEHVLLLETQTEPVSDGEAGGPREVEVGDNDQDHRDGAFPMERNKPQGAPASAALGLARDSGTALALPWEEGPSGVCAKHRTSWSDVETSTVGTLKSGQKKTECLERKP